MGDILRIVHNGKLTVNNVPYTPFDLGYSPDASKEYLTSDVVYNLAKIFTYTLEHDTFEIDYSEYEYIH